MSRPKKIESAILIQASREEVWAVFSGFHTYFEWNPFIKKIDGVLKVGAPLQIEIQLLGRQPVHFQPRLKTYEETYSLSWVGVLGNALLFRGEHYFHLESMADGQVRFTQGEAFSGLLAGLILRFIRKATQAGFHEMNLALKHRVLSVMKGEQACQ